MNSDDKNNSLVSSQDRNNLISIDGKGLYYSDVNNYYYSLDKNERIIPLISPLNNRLVPTKKDGIYHSTAENKDYYLTSDGMLKEYQPIKENRFDDKVKDDDLSKEEVAKAYGLSLTDIEQIKLDNGKEFFKFYNKDDQSIKMIENSNYNKNLSMQFKDQQTDLDLAKQDDSKENAEKIFEYENKYHKKEIALIPIALLKDNFKSYAYYFDNLDSKTILAIKTLLNYSDELDLRYINIENALAIDSQNRVINSLYNSKDGKCEVKQATVLYYEDQSKYVNENNIEIDLTNIDFDTIVSQLDMASDNPIEIDGEIIYPSQFKFYNDYSDKPELIEQNNNLTSKQKLIYEHLIIAYKRYMMRKEETIKNTHQKVYTKEDNKRAAFADVILLSLLTGFFGGIIVTILILFLKTQI